MIKNIIFDFGGVILKHKPTITQDILAEMFPDSYDEVEKIWNRYKLLLNTGKKTSIDFLTEVKNSTYTKLSIDALKTKWKALYKVRADDVDWELLDFIEQLKNKYHVYLFTDTIDVHDEYNRTRNIYSKFDKVYKSFEEGIAKSGGKEAYQYILEKIKAKSEECIFIDDLEQNVMNAKTVGIKGIVYKDLVQLKKDLKSNGVSF